VLIWLRYRF